MSESQLTDYLGFVYNEKDCELLSKSFGDSAYVRLPLQNAEKLVHCLPKASRKWIDAEVDSLDRWSEKSFQYRNYLNQFGKADLMMDPGFQAKPDCAIVRDFVASILTRCASLGPSALSVPQLPIADDNKRNKLNRELARATAAWADSSRFSGQFILPVIFTHSAQYLRKTARNPKVKLMRQCFDSAKAKGLWVVDASLFDQEGTKPLEPRFRALIDLHTELCLKFPSTSVVAGPYWAFNIVLWAKGLIKYPAVSLGNRYKYYIPGGLAQTPKTRIAFDSIKRWTVVNGDLRMWLTEAAAAVPPGDPAHVEFARLSTNFSKLLLGGNNREEICRVQRKWLDSLSVVPAAGRALALYQQLSSAYVLGKSLPDLPEEGSARRPERIAQQLMMFCL